MDNLENAILLETENYLGILIVVVAHGPPTLITLIIQGSRRNRRATATSDERRRTEAERRRWHMLRRAAPPWRRHGCSRAAPLWEIRTISPDRRQLLFQISWGNPRIRTRRKKPLRLLQALFAPNLSRSPTKWVKTLKFRRSRRQRPALMLILEPYLAMKSGRLS